MRGMAIDYTALVKEHGALNVARMLRVDESTVSRWKQQRTKPDGDQIFKMLAVGLITFTDAMSEGQRLLRCAEAPRLPGDDRCPNGGAE